MASLLIVRPQPAAYVGGSDFSFALTPDPKEAAYIPAAAASMTVDLGAVYSIDTAYAGYHSAVDNQTWNVIATNAQGNVVNGSFGAELPIGQPGTPYPRHAFRRIDAPIASRYWQFQFPAAASACVIGVLALGLSMQPQYGHEYGSGRFVGDTGQINRLRSGGFGIDPGVTFTGWQWTMGDLTDDEVATLYRFQRDMGATRSALVIEDPDATPGLNDRIHWGLLKLEAYERVAPGATRWAMTINDWA